MGVARQKKQKYLILLDSPSKIIFDSMGIPVFSLNRRILLQNLVAVHPS